MTSHITTAVQVAAASYDLVDLPAVKDELQLTSGDTQHDTWLKRGISQASAAISNYCNRVFQVEVVVDTLNFERDPARRQIRTALHSLKLERWPVIAVQSIVEDGTALVAGTDFTVDYNGGQIFRMTPDGLLTRSWPPLQTVVTYVAGYGQKASQVALIPATPGPYTISVTNLATFFLDQGVTYVGGAALVPVASAPAAGQYSVAAGVYTFSTADQGRNVSISYIYTSIPYDLSEAALRLVTMRFKQRGRDPMLVSSESPGIGLQRWWVGPTPGQNGAFPPEIDGLLEAYCVPVVA